MKHVLLFKEPKPDDPYVQKLQSVGFAAACLPVLSFKYINSNVLRQVLAEPDEYSSIVFTSQRATQAVEHCVLQSNTLDQFHLENAASSLTSGALNEVTDIADWAVLREKWAEKPCYVVGQATARKAQELGFRCCGQESGSAEKLVPILLADVDESSKPVVFPCGNLKKETLPNALHNKGVAVRCVTAYETSADENIEQALRNHVDTKGVPGYLVFFSPSGVTFCLPYLRSLTFPAEDVKMIAIGGTTADAMAKNGLVVSATCVTPDPDGLARALLSASSACVMVGQSGCELTKGTGENT